MHYDDHPPPHFHAHYSGARAVFLIREGIFSEGVLPIAQGRRIRDWARRHRDDLLLNWTRIEQGVPVQRIPED
jgi:hypothetical protein